MIAKIAVSAAVYAIDKAYAYAVPERLQGECCPGKRALVPFGRGNKATEGIILTVTDGPVDTLKEISDILDTEPVMDAEALRTAAFVRERCFCTYFDAAHAMLPAGLWFQKKETYTLTEPEADFTALCAKKPEMISFVQTLRDYGGRADRDCLIKSMTSEYISAATAYWKQKKQLTVTGRTKRKVLDKTEQIASLCVDSDTLAHFFQSAKRAPLQCAVLELLRTIGSGSVKEIAYYTGASGSVFRRLESLGLITLSENEVFRRPHVRETEPAELPELNAEQENAYQILRTQAEKENPGAALLYGVTGSGKTSVYIRMIQTCLEQGKTALLLVPEIALTPQLILQMSSHFGNQIGILHSSLHVGERYDEWKRIRRGDAKIVIGTRSAVFAPLPNFGLIILDEEQEHSYKSENTPRYHARDVALYRAGRTGALVILGSATPSLESMYRAKQGIYMLVEIHGRYNGKNLPEVTIGDLKEDLKKGNDTAYGAIMRNALEQTVSRREQAILLLNRRGSGRRLTCIDCGETPQCPRCSVSLTYHSANGRLMCHYCGYSQPLIERCPSCGGHLKPVGIGTQKAEEQLLEAYPGIQVARMDADTISAVHTHEQFLTEFGEGKQDVLIGTQMVAKGLNFDRVTLVGVLDADSQLCAENYRASETAFSMLTQVVGRAGRGNTPGHAVIQTLNPENRVIRLAAMQDYNAFYEMEIETRRLRKLPPFRDLFTISFTGLNERDVQSAAVKFREKLLVTVPTERFSGLSVDVLGPAPAPVLKINHVYHYRLTLGMQNSKMARNLVSDMLHWFAGDKECKAVRAFADINSPE